MNTRDNTLTEFQRALQAIEDFNKQELQVVTSCGH